MPGPIRMRFKEAPQRFTAAPGQEDTWRAKLDALQAILNYPDDTYAASQRAAAVAVHNDFEDWRRFVWSLADDVQSMTSAIRGAIVGRQRADAATVPTSGFGSPLDRERAIAARAKKIETDMLHEATRGVLDAGEVQQRAADLSNKICVDMRDLQDAYDAAVADFFGPPSMTSSDLTVEEMMRLTRIENELRAVPPGKLFELFANYVKRKDLEKCWTFVDASVGLLAEYRQTPNAMLMKRTNARASQQTDQVDDIRTSLFKLDKAIDDFKNAQTPQSILSTSAFISGARALFAETLGFSPANLSVGEFSALYLETDTGLRLSQQDPLRLATDPIGRFINTGRVSLPGWSPITGNTSAGVYYRKAG